VVTSVRDGPDSVFERELPDADIVISQPFWPAYLTRSASPRPTAEAAITARIGSDHYDLQAASEAGLTIAEITYSNSISVSEHVVMMILSLCATHPLLPVGSQGGWTSPTVSSALTTWRAWRSARWRQAGLARQCWRLKPFDVKLCYTDLHRLPADVERNRGHVL
jgi:formate dehydrogenase